MRGSSILLEIQHDVVGDHRPEMRVGKPLLSRVTLEYLYGGLAGKAD